MEETVNTKNILFKILFNVLISIAIAAPVFALFLLYIYKIWIINQIPVYLFSSIIAVVSFSLSIKLFPAVNKAVKNRQFGIDRLIRDLNKNTREIRNIRDIIKQASDLLIKFFSVKSIYIFLLNNETGVFEKYYSAGADIDITQLDIDSPLVKWFSENKDILIPETIINTEDESASVKNDVEKFVLKQNIKVLLPVHNRKQIIGLICLGEKLHPVSYNSDDLKRLRNFYPELDRIIAGAADYDEWNRGQFVSGMLDLSSELLAKAVPMNLPKLQDMSFGAFYIPRYREGIDYFDIITPTPTGAGVIATDISGRGINNAIYSVILRSAFHSCIEEAHTTYDVIRKLNRALFEYTKGVGGIAKAYYFYYNIYTMSLTYTSAAFQPLEIYRVDKNVYESLDTEGFPLGTDISADYGMGRTNLLVGDIGFLYSRALIESKNPQGEKFGLTQLREIIKENRRRHPSEITAILKEKFLTFMGPSSPGANILVIIFKV